MPGPTGPSPRLIGLTLASLMVVVFAFIIWRSMGTGTAAPNQQNLFPDDPSEIPDLSDLEEGASMFVTIVDRDDPTRVAGTLEADQFEPIGGGQRRLVNPDAWIYMRDGRRVHITAQDGLVLMPDPNEAPESGTLEGDVTIRVYDASVSSADAMNAAMGMNDSPSMIATFDEPVGFERRYMRLTSEGRFTLDSAGLSFIGHELTVMLNEVKGRVELIDVRRGERLVLRPEAQKNAAVTRAKKVNRAPVYKIETVAYSRIAQDTTAPKTASSGTQVATTIEPAAVDKKPYHVEIKDEVLVDVIGSGTLRADGLDIWAMLIDGGLSSEAIKQIKFATTPEDDASKAPTQQPATTQTQSAPAQPLSKPKPAASTTRPAVESTPKPKPIVHPSVVATSDDVAEEGEVVVTWVGPLVVHPVEDPSSTALATDELAFVFSSSSDRVRFAGYEQGVHGSADAVEYYASRGVLELLGGVDSPIELTADEAGTLRALGLIADLDAGTISIDSAGELVSIQATDSPRARIDWETGASFDLVKTDTGELSGRLQAARFTGDVLGTRGDSVVEASELIAALDREGDIESALRTITLNTGSMRSDSGSLAGDEIVIGFVPMTDGSKGVAPVTLDANGSVVGFSDDGRVQTDSMSAILVREYNGQTRIQRASAIGKTEFMGRDETKASGSRVDLNTDNDTIFITGDGNKLAMAGQGGSVIHGPEIWINTRSRSIKVDGKGSFDHDIVTQDAPAGGHLRVTWNESMRFEDAMGVIECKGDVVAVSTPDAFTIDTLKAERLEIELTPAPSAKPIRDPDAIVVDDSVQRELLVARAMGRAVPGGDPILASVESRTYDPKNPERAIGVMYLEGPQIIANNERQSLRVPSAGMMVLMDRSEDSGDQNEDSAMSSDTGPGLTRMSWDGSMNFERAVGQALVMGGVNIRHKSLTTGNISQIECDQLNAKFTASNQGEEVSAIAMKRAEASGNVRFTDLQRTLMSDHAIYDAVAETLFAFADADRLVTLRDAANPPPTSAKTLLWDLKKDLVKIDAPSPVRAPSRP